MTSRRNPSAIDALVDSYFDDLSVLSPSISLFLGTENSHGFDDYSPEGLKAANDLRAHTLADIDAAEAQASVEGNLDETDVVTIDAMRGDGDLFVVFLLLPFDVQNVLRSRALPPDRSAGDPSDVSCSSRLEFAGSSRDSRAACCPRIQICLSTRQIRCHLSLQQPLDSLAKKQPFTERPTKPMSAQEREPTGALPHDGSHWKAGSPSSTPSCSPFRWGGELGFAGYTGCRQPGASMTRADAMIADGNFPTELSNDLHDDGPRPSDGFPRARRHQRIAEAPTTGRTHPTILWPKPMQ